MSDIPYSEITKAREEMTAHREEWAKAILASDMCNSILGTDPESAAKRLFAMADAMIAELHK